MITNGPKQDIIKRQAMGEDRAPSARAGAIKERRAQVYPESALFRGYSLDFVDGSAMEGVATGIPQSIDLLA